ncbi:hypothetical protein HHI36_009722, partial [Cryptolaemus montrouzieri]
MIQAYSITSVLTAEEICFFLTKLSDSTNLTFLDKTSSELSDRQLFYFANFNSAQLQVLKQLLVSMRSKNSRNIIKTLVVCLFELRTEASNNFIAFVFEIDNEIKISDFCESVINSFEGDVLPTHLLRRVRITATNKSLIQ